MKKLNVFELVLTSTFVAIILIMSLIPQLGFITIVPGVSLTIIHIPTLIGIFLLKPRSGFILGVAFGVGSLIAAFLYGGPLDLAFQNPLVSVLPRAIFGIVAYYIYRGLSLVGKIKHGNTVIFGLVSLITIFGLYFGSLKIAEDAIFNPYNNMVLENNEYLKENPGGIPPYDEEALKVVYDASSKKLKDLSNYLIPVVFIVIAVFIAIYYSLIINNKYDDLVIPASFLISTLFHTVVVVSALVLFGGIMRVAFGPAISFIYALVLSNGLIESLVALIVGTPIYFALKKMPQLDNIHK